MLCGFDADDEPVDACFATGGATIGLLDVVGVVAFGFAFGRGRADSLLTRTDAGTCKATILRSEFHATTDTRQSIPVDEDVIEMNDQKHYKFILYQ